MREFREKDAIYLVAEIDRTIAGYARATVKKSNDAFFIMPARGFLEAIVVRKKYRGMGIASALNTEVERWFHANRCVQATLDVIAGNPAQRIYKKWGYAVGCHRMSKRLR